MAVRTSDVVVDAVAVAVLPPEDEPPPQPVRRYIDVVITTAKQREREVIGSLLVIELN